MESFIYELSAKKILSIEDIVLLKEYIDRKYVNYSTSQKSNTLANAVHKVLDRNIQGLDNKYKQILKHDLLKNTILKNGQPILLIDIFNICISMEHKSNDFIESLKCWINIHVEDKISESDLEKYYIKLDTIDSTTYIASPIKHKTLYPILIRLKEFLNLRLITCLSCIFIGLLIVISQNLFKLNSVPISSTKNPSFSDSKLSLNIIRGIPIQATTNKSTAINPVLSCTSNLPPNFKYKDINQVMLKKYLTEQNSLLAEEPYFSTILSVSKEYDLNPLVLFAITGQEQGFVPKQDSHSSKIANNPFNINHSWIDYNTSIDDACRIVSMTIINICKDRPENEEAFKWINRKYAEDKHWSKFVTIIYNKLESNNLLNN